ncbi:bifunctional chorismate mutase/prephenate dehydratase [Intestinibacillus sp. Marseille-P6563]|uniref:bifunctional chorismate mutase/prephenate dehydratase n=1 Tax=Intestinibacillus sp. Marseille-P6563 TaxID=2364792 RepID=UPI0013E0E55F|nr:bifunctional chorismate mutase/prephenate dehydratase [Intestinibacillus sp. Marseille-P6563]
MRSLNEIRQDINQIDAQMQALFLQRMELAEQVAECKMVTGDKVLKPDREQAMLETLQQQVPASLQPEYVSMLKGLIRVSRMHQYEHILSKDPAKLTLPVAERLQMTKSVVYQGLPASYQSQAAQVMFPQAETIDHVSTFEDVFRAVAEHRADVGVVPIENSSIGTINEVCDLLMKYDLYISHSHINAIRHCLAGCKHATMDTVEKVYSIEPALDQCQNYLRQHGFTLCKAANTAVAAKQVQEWNDPSCAAVCSEDAARLYGLKILAAAINDDCTNQTRFVAVSRQLSACETDNRVSLAFTLPHQQGTLSAALSMFSDHNINLTEIHSRPLPETPWNYRFYVDLEGSLASENVRSLIYQLSEELRSLRLLGSYQITQTKEDCPT